MKILKRKQSEWIWISQLIQYLLSSALSEVAIMFY